MAKVAAAVVVLACALAGAAAMRTAAFTVADGGSDFAAGLLQELGLPLDAALACAESTPLGEQFDAFLETFPKAIVVGEQAGYVADSRQLAPAVSALNAAVADLKRVVGQCAPRKATKANQRRLSWAPTQDDGLYAWIADAITAWELALQGGATCVAEIFVAGTIRLPCYLFYGLDGEANGDSSGNCGYDSDAVEWDTGCICDYPVPETCSLTQTNAGISRSVFQSLTSIRSALSARKAGDQLESGIYAGKMLKGLFRVSNVLAH